MVKAPLIVAGIVFAVVALIHLARLFVGFPVIIAGNDIPMWGSVLGFIITGLLAIWMFYAASASRGHN